MLQQELLKRVVEVLDSADIAYMVTGSVASSLQGEPRSTHDADLLVEVEQGKFEVLINAFPPPRFYLDPESIVEAVRDGTMFNLIDTEEGDKIDFWLVKDEPFDRERFSRRQLHALFGFDAFISTPEDTILSKLAWSKQYGGSQKQFGDALRVFEVQFDTLDLKYLETWSDQLQVNELFRQLRDQADPL
jgi:hypothetical protein